MSIHARYTAKRQTAALIIALVGISVGIIAVMGTSIVRPTVLAFLFGGLILLLPTLIVREPSAYWQFLFVSSFLVDVSKRLTTWLVAPPDLSYEFGFPPSGILSIDIYVTDIILLVILLPWLGDLSRRRTTLYFPSVAYLFVLYLAWALLMALVLSKSLYLSIFEWCRELLYFLSFIYIINNTLKRSHLRAIALALLVGLTVASASVIVTFALKIEPGNLFQGVYHQTETINPEPKQSGESSREGNNPYQRAAGIFVHPADATYYFAYILPVVLGYFVARRRIQDRLLYGAVFALTCVATYLTFSRAGLISLFVAMLMFFPLAGWSGLISRRALVRWLFVLSTLVVLVSPVVFYSLWTRPETITKRLELNQKALVTIAERPIFGGGLNNSSAVMEGTHDVSTTSRGSEVRTEVVHNYYLEVLIDVGIVGFLLLFAFFGCTTIIGIQHLRAAEPELKILLVGIVAGFTSIAVHFLGDPFGAHQAVAMLWLYLGLVIAICRLVRTEQATPAYRFVDTPRLARGHPGPADGVKPHRRRGSPYI